MHRTYLTVMAALLGAFTLMAATIIPVVLPSYSFTSTVTVPISNSDLQPMYLTAVEIVFAAASSNTVSISHVSPGVTNKLLTVSDASMSTLTWYVPRPLFLKDGDSLVVACTATNSAIMKLSAEKYKN